MSFAPVHLLVSLSRQYYHRHAFSDKLHQFEDILILYSHASVAASAAHRPWSIGAVDARGVESRSHDAEEARTILSRVLAAHAILVGIVPVLAVLHLARPEETLRRAAVAPAPLVAESLSAGTGVRLAQHTVAVEQLHLHVALVHDDEIFVFTVEQTVAVVQTVVCHLVHDAGGIAVFVRRLVHIFYRLLGSAELMLYLYRFFLNLLNLVGRCQRTVILGHLVAFVRRRASLHYQSQYREEYG